MTRDEGDLGPVDDLRGKRDRDKQPGRGTAIWYLSVEVSLSHFSSIPHVTSPTTQERGRMLVGDLGVGSGSNR